MFEAVIFDMDGLMFDTEAMGLAANHGALLAQGRTLGREESDALFRQVLGMIERDSRRVYSALLGEDFDFDRWRADFRRQLEGELHKSGTPLKPGLMELLNFLDARGIRYAIASGSDRRRVECCVECAGLTHRFGLIVCGDMVKAGKPEPEIFLITAEALKVRPERCLVLEDSPNGIKAAVRAGMKAVMVPDLIQPTDIERETAFYIVDSLYDIPAMIDRENGAGL